MIAPSPCEAGLFSRHVSALPGKNSASLSAKIRLPARKRRLNRGFRRDYVRDGASGVRMTPEGDFRTRWLQKTCIPASADGGRLSGSPDHWVRSVVPGAVPFDATRGGYLLVIGRRSCPIWGGHGSPAAGRSGGERDDPLPDCYCPARGPCGEAVPRAFLWWPWLGSPHVGWLVWRTRHVGRLGARMGLGWSWPA